MSLSTYEEMEMPVILTTCEETSAWLRAPSIGTAGLQRPLVDGSLRLVARGKQESPLEPAMGATP